MPVLHRLCPCICFRLLTGPVCPLHRAGAALVSSHTTWGVSSSPRGRLVGTAGEASASGHPWRSRWSRCVAYDATAAAGRLRGRFSGSGLSRVCCPEREKGLARLSFLSLQDLLRVTHAVRIGPQQVAPLLRIVGERSHLCYVTPLLRIVFWGVLDQQVPRHSGQLGT